MTQLQPLLEAAQIRILISDFDRIVQFLNCDIATEEKHGVFDRSDVTYSLLTGMLAARRDIHRCARSAPSGDQGTPVRASRRLTVHRPNCQALAGGFCALTRFVTMTEVTPAAEALLLVVAQRPTMMARTGMPTIMRT